MADFSDGVIEFTRGDTKKVRFTVKDRLTLTAQDITNWSAFRFTAKDRVGDADNAAILSETLAGSGISKIDPTNGVLEVTVAAADTASLNYETYELVADLQGVDASSNNWTLWKGRVIIYPDASRTSP